MLIDLDKIRNCDSIRIKISEESFDCYLQNVNEYFTVLEKDIFTIKPKETMDVISALVGFKEYFCLESEWERLALRSLDILRKGINKSFFNDTAIFFGLAHVAYAVYGLTAKAPKIRSFLQGINDMLLNKLTEELKASDKKEFYTIGNYEAIKGFSGPFRYLLENNGDNKTDEMIRRLIGVFIKRSKNISILDHQVTGWHYYPSAMEKRFMDAEAANGCINYGVSHGMGGPLPVLSMAYHKGYDVEGLKDAIDGLISEYMNAVYYAGDIAYWPGRITFEQYIGQDKMPDTPNAMSWCYGSVGILRALYMAGDFISNDEAKQFALDELIKIAMLDLPSYMLSQPIVCHGYIGTAAVLNLMYLDTGKEEFLHKTIEMIEASIGFNIERFFENAHQVARNNNAETLATLHDHLEGFNGIVHSILSIIKGIPTENEKRLLML